MKKTSCIIFVAVIALSVPSLFSCDGKFAGHELLGKWDHAGEIIEFCEDGTLLYNGKEYAFSVNGHTVSLDRDGTALNFDYALNPNGTLILGDLIYYPVGQKLKTSDDSSSNTASFFEKSMADE